MDNAAVFWIFGLLCSAKALNKR